MPREPSNDRGIRHEIMAAEIVAQHMTDATYSLSWQFRLTGSEWLGWMGFDMPAEASRKHQQEFDAGYLARHVLRSK